MTEENATYKIKGEQIIDYTVLQLPHCATCDQKLILEPVSHAPHFASIEARCPECGKAFTVMVIADTLATVMGRLKVLTESEG